MDIDRDCAVRNVECTEARGYRVECCRLLQVDAQVLAGEADYLGPLLEGEVVSASRVVLHDCGSIAQPHVAFERVVGARQRMTNLPAPVGIMRVAERGGVVTWSESMHRAKLGIDRECLQVVEVQCWTSAQLLAVTRCGLPFPHGH